MGRLYLHPQSHQGHSGAHWNHFADDDQSDFLIVVSGSCTCAVHVSLLLNNTRDAQVLASVQCMTLQDAEAFLRSRGNQSIRQLRIPIHRTFQGICRPDNLRNRSLKQSRGGYRLRTRHATNRPENITPPLEAQGYPEWKSDSTRATLIERAGIIYASAIMK